jgi:hypothetical protein
MEAEEEVVALRCSSEAFKAAVVLREGIPPHPEPREGRNGWALGKNVRRETRVGERKVIAGAELCGLRLCDPQVHSRMVTSHWVLYNIKKSQYVGPSPAVFLKINRCSIDLNDRSGWEATTPRRR